MPGWNISVPTTEYYGPDPLSMQWDPRNLEKMQALVAELRNTPLIAIDTETTGLVLWKERVLYFSLAWGNRRCTLHAQCLPFFQELFQDPTKWWVFANAKFDCHMLSNMGCHIYGNTLDTQVQHALLYEDKPHKLKYMCKHIGGWTWGDFQDQFGKIGARQSAEDLIRRAEREDFGRLVEYAANDAWGTLLVYNALKTQLEAAPTHSLFRTTPPHIETLWDLFYKVEAPYTKTLWRMERHGARVDRQRLEDAKPQAEAEIARLEREIWRHAGRSLNPNSPPQLIEYFIEQQGLKPLSWTAGGKKGIRKPQVNERFLKHYEDEHPVAKAILEHRKYSKLYGTYLVGLHGMLDPYDRIHTKYNQDVARTGRLSSSEPNLQNIPRPENDHWNLRSAFIPPPGYKILCFDYAQLEMRLLAAASLEQPMIDMIHSGKDIHTGNAELVFGIPYDDIVSAKKKKGSGEQLSDYEQHCVLVRRAVKDIGFGIVYGMGERKMAAGLGITEDEARAKIAQFNDAYPAVARFAEETIAETTATGYAFTVLGRRRNVPEIRSRSRSERGRGERLAKNTPIQGSAADVVKMAQILYDKLGFEREFGCKMIMQVHDELVFECPDESVEPMCKEIPELMRHPFSSDLAVRLDVDGGPGMSWGEAK